MTSEHLTPLMPAGPRAGFRLYAHEAVSTTITHGYVEMLRRLGRNQEAAALEARAR